MSGAVSKDCIDYLSGKIREVEVSVEDRVELLKPYAGLQTVPGIGRIISLTVMLETGYQRRRESQPFLVVRKSATGSGLYPAIFILPFNSA
jgi:hypothetical protein